MSDPHPSEMDPVHVGRKHDETREGVDGPALIIIVPLLIGAGLLSFYGLSDGWTAASMPLQEEPNAPTE